MTLTREQMVVTKSPGQSSRVKNRSTLTTITGAKQSGIACCDGPLPAESRLVACRQGLTWLSRCSRTGSKSLSDANIRHSRRTSRTSPSTGYPSVVHWTEPNTREDERIAYQRGEREVIIFTPVEGFSLPQGTRSLAGTTFHG